jgi:hypoxia up-regulated 1
MLTPPFRKIEEPIVIRFSEFQTRGKAIEDFQQAMFAARAFFVEAHKNNTATEELLKEATPEKPVAPKKYLDEELKEVEGMLKDNEKWMDGLMEVQAKIDVEGDKTKDPVIFSKDLNERGKKLQMTVSVLTSLTSTVGHPGRLVFFEKDLLLIPALSLGPKADQ